MRWLLAGVLALVSAFAAHHIATGLMGVTPGLEAQIVAAMAGVMVGAGYETLARADQEEEG
ncbi:hypothetical protein [Indioceanicola profundi]|uniref:hypothetical protein n=1 Tax=Indioceanicola profundi TaxID=2220096 RepID=UPI0013C4A906|nr:hypothetical protein [Indioceanicola profundi]